MAAINIGRVVQARQAIKDARTVARHAWETADAALEADQDKLDTLMLSILNEQGASSIKTDFGTAIRTEKLKPSAADWNAIWTWMKENDAPDLVERRLKTTFIKQYMDEHENRLPPGINVHREYEVSVRRPTSAGTTTDE